MYTVGHYKREQSSWLRNGKEVNKCVHQAADGVDPEVPRCQGDAWLCQNVQNSSKYERQDVFNVVSMNSERKNVKHGN